ncbi:hypothetical protein A2631_01630 [Candidatus Daviesbacteria bacterium RIFCSPHIGHO2_01_FULL_44_29]|uniref:Major facilitator superfamily (MFS) profile domain-containing protein n=1 Tax=Candidatus Daviesbacteria bacterium RIFCSPHIGHO2_02_FULL_43_12 TaxID=1797776 RepID=A0A1F5KJY0_9BACT|nr:MAG: hypothetical protein A2631_01630 [Candidatus Daviesbacteria bacterium RIFCSPHIGHO2_01_FULL_44_29]OGE41105.1 MAG: hypothetical protein A3D25_01025 [Candidatus Daviesbacteria bacterium RIFCSPHIGHO2_02_FULL_43_12]OGE69304.1 MAG: hypothetical protein A3B55_02765 [Candidatus Daviesbacteria bacterium RIFCSPLOWO2_01_FULL_43_15]
MKNIRLFTARTFSSLKIRNYRLYFLGQAVSLSGTWMQTIGQGLLVLKLTGSGTALGLVTALQFLPILILGPWGGVITDRFPKRKILFITQSISGILALILGILVITTSIKLWMVYLLALSLGVVNTFDNPTRQTFLMEMVGAENLSNVISLNSSEVNMARIIGPAIAGVLIATFGLGICFIINGLSYGAILIVLMLMKKQELLSLPLVQKSKGQLLEGFRYIRSSPLILYTLLMMAIIGTLSYEFSVILPLFAKFTFRGDAGSYALLTGAMGVGSVIGGLITASRHKTSPQMLVWAAFLFGISLLAASLATTLIMAVVAMVVVGIFSINFTSLGNIILQLESIPEMRGRVMSFWTVAFLGSTPIGGPIIGWIGEHIGPRWGLVVGGMAAIAASGFGFLTLSKGIKFVIPDDLQRNATLVEAEKESRVF